MRLLKNSTRQRPKVSLILLDWSVRESFHLLHYLKQQTVPRDDFEAIVIEFYSRVSDAVLKFEDEVDTWVVLDMPASCCHHKHLMYNAGIALARGNIVMIGDSDAMAKSTFIATILKNFAADADIVYHMDEFRNMRRDLYPFNYPSFEAVLGEGCFNNAGGRTTGVLNKQDPIHARNYGACMCARRADLIAIGGADMHIDYAGHICGPYDMTFRLTNFGRREVWDMDEFLYHTWHPGQAGADNYMGPHDGRHMSTTALEAITSHRIRPLLEHEAIRLLRTGAARSATDILDKLVDPRYAAAWNTLELEQNGALRRWSDYRVPLGVYNGYRLEAEVDRVFAYPINQPDTQWPQDGKRRWVFEGGDAAEVKARIDRSIPLSLMLFGRFAATLKLLARAGQSLSYRSQRISVPLGRRTKIVLAGILALRTVLALLVREPRRLVGRSRRVLFEAGSSSGSLVTLAVTLRGLAGQGKAQIPASETLVLAEDAQTVFLLPWLARLRLVPRLEARRIAGVTDLERCLQELERQHWSGRLIVPGLLYTRFHTTIAASMMSRQAIIA
jgi:hypothetical protein